MTDPRLSAPEAYAEQRTGLAPQHLQAAPALLSGPPPTPAQITEYPLSFTGSAGEYFRVWIVNMALTLVTLGVYLPWARVRNRQYFSGHTWLDGHNFEYRANPVALLKGYLLVAALFVAYAVSGQFEQFQWVAGLLGLLFFALYPWLVRQSMRFQAINTVHRGLNFRFHGLTGDAYVAYLVGNLAAAFSAGLALPWAWYMQRRYQLDHLAYGSARARFRGEVGPFYLIGLTGLGLSVGGGFLIVVPVVLSLGLVIGNDPMLGETSGSTAALLTGVGIAYVSALLLYLVIWQYVRGASMAYVLNNAELGGVVRARATFSPWRLMWISVSNAAAQVLTLGLATPWAAVRRTKYIVQGLQIRAIASLDDFATGVATNESAFGEAASDLLDIQVGF